MKKIILLLIACLLYVPIYTHAQKTVLKGKVHKWVSDTIYVNKLSFHSPHSGWVQKIAISKDSTFYFEWTKIKEPMIISISPLKSFVDQTSYTLLFENFTKDHKMSYCLKAYNSGITILYLEPNKTLNVELIMNTWFDTLSDERADFFRKKGVKIGKDNRVRDYGKTEVKFIGDSDNFANNYFLNFPYQINKIEQAIDTYSSKNLDLAIANIKSAEKDLMKDLNKNKHKFSENLYEHLAGEIKYGAKKDLFKYLVLDQPAYYKNLISSGNIPENIADMIVFEKNSVNKNTYKTEMYAEFIEFYLTFIMNVVERQYKPYREFEMNKFTIAIDELPEESAYYYLVNNLIETNKKKQFDNIINRFINKYPNGELNEKLISEYKNM